MKGVKKMTQFLTDMGALVTSVVGWFGDVLGLFVSEPALTVVFGIFVLSAIIGLVTKLSHAR